MPSKKDVARRFEQMNKILKGLWDASEIENLMARKFEEKIRSGNFNQISNIPFEISRLHAELAEIAKQELLVKGVDRSGIIY